MPMGIITNNLKHKECKLNSVSVPLFRLNDNQQYFSFVGVKEIYVHF